MSSSLLRSVLIARIERTAMMLRYGAYFVIALLVIFDSVHWHATSLAVATALVVLHNSFVHAALLSGRIRWFQSPFNLALYGVEAALGVWAAELSYMAALSYAFLLIAGSCVYASRSRTVLAVSLACAACCLLLDACRTWLGMPARPLLELALGPACCIACGILLAWFHGMAVKREAEREDSSEPAADSLPPLREVLNGMPDAVLVCNEAGEILEVNQAACDLFGAAFGRLVGSLIQTVLFDDGTLVDKMARARQTGLAESEEAIAGASGGERRVRIQLRARVKQEQVLYVIAARDMGGQQNPTEAMRTEPGPPEQSGQRRPREWVTDYSMATAQRVRSPLSAILGYVDLLLEEELGPLNHSQRNALQTSRRSARRIVRMLDEASASLPLSHVPETPAASQKPERSG